MIPQIIFLMILFLRGGISIERHGRERTGKYNFFIDLVSGLVMLSLLFWGGFFDVFIK